MFRLIDVLIWQTRRLYAGTGWVRCCRTLCLVMGSCTLSSSWTQRGRCASVSQCRPVQSPASTHDAIHRLRTPGQTDLLFDRDTLMPSMTLCVQGQGQRLTEKNKAKVKAIVLGPRPRSCSRRL